MPKAITIELPADSEGLRRKLGELSRIAAPDNPYRGQSESEIVRQLVIEALETRQRLLSKTMAAIDTLTEEATAAIVAALEASKKPVPVPPIAPGSYSRETLPPLGGRAQALLDSIWDEADAAGGPKAARAKRRAGSRKPRGGLKLTDHGGDSVVEYLARR